MKLHVAVLEDPHQAKYDEICTSKKIKYKTIYFLACTQFVILGLTMAF